MPEFFLFAVFAALAGAIPVRSLLIRFKVTPLLDESGEKLTVKDLLINLGFEITAIAVLLEAIKGMIITLVALNFWYSWQWVAVMGILTAIVVHRATNNCYCLRGTAIFCGGLLIIDPAMLKLFLAMWLSLLILLRNQQFTHILSLTAFSLAVWWSGAPAYLYLLGFGCMTVTIIMEFWQKYCFLPEDFRQ